MHSCHSTATAISRCPILRPKISYMMLYLSLCFGLMPMLWVCKSTTTFHIFLKHWEAEMCWISQLSAIRIIVISARYLLKTHWTLSMEITAPNNWSTLSWDSLRPSPRECLFFSLTYLTTILSSIKLAGLSVHLIAIMFRISSVRGMAHGAKSLPILPNNLITWSLYHNFHCGIFLEKMIQKMSRKLVTAVWMV